MAKSILNSSSTDPNKILPMNYLWPREYFIRGVIINWVVEYTGHMVKFEYGPRRPGDRPVVIANPGKIQRVLGWQPQYSDLKTIITTAWAWHKKRFGNF